ncbi:hypothetical protein QQA45_05185 [Sneathia sanguinegens]|uniref:Autotransporter domain-containing protein n=1 Tax=Sneathia sanguinegens TaxID=40543 RepID=A0ABT7HL47_9FUSO|nr:hypothetical protein [Sneathia sanguinegens]MDK9580907.1 hypothetical protein [Sneathia sanguinegens]
MKKTIMLATIVASLYSMANSISGHVEFINNNNLKVETTKKELEDKDITPSATGTTNSAATPKKTYKSEKDGSTKPSFKTDLGVKTEITLNKIGLSFGAEFMGKDAELYPNKDKKAGYKFSEDSNVYLKYQIPEFMNIKSSAKLGFIPKVSKGKDDKASFAGEALIELEGSYILDTINLNLNSSTHLPLYKPSEGTYGDKMFSVHKLTAKGETGVIKDLDAYLEIKNDYSIFNASNNQDTSSPLKYVKGGLVGDYKDVKNLTLTAHADFLYLPSDDNDGQTTKNILKNDDEKLTVANSYSQAYEFEAKYTMLENKLDLKASLLGQHVHTGGHTVQVGDVHEYVNKLNDLKTKLSAIKDDCKTEIDSKIVENFKDEKDLKDALDKLNANIKKNNTTSNTATPANNDPKANTHTTAEVTPPASTTTNNGVKKDAEDCITKIEALLNKVKENNYNDNDTTSKLNKLRNDKKSNATTEKAYFGTKLGVAYRPLNNLEITAGTVLGGTYVQNFEDNEEDKIGGYDITGYIRLDSCVKYVYTPVKNITVVPEFNISGSVDNLDARNKNKFLSAKLNLNPKASIAYTPIKNLEIAGLVELPIEFKHVITEYTTPKDGGLLNDDNIYNKRKFAYSSTTFKTGLNIKYSW